MKFASLGSGSEGNGLVISVTSGITRTAVLLDCGFSVRETERRIARLGMSPADLSGIVVTHEHQDHVGGVFILARRYGLPVWLSYGTYQAIERDTSSVVLHFCRDGERFSIGDIQLVPYTVPHDAREPIQYVLSDGCVQLGVLTDAGHATPHMVAALGGCDALMLECNHDRTMLANSAYPPSLKQRIGGAYGHLSNEVTGQVLAAVNQTKLKKVVGAHLSRQNNTVELARAALADALVMPSTEVMIACQDDGFDWVALRG